MKKITLGFAALLLAAPMFAQLERPHRAARTVLTDDDDGKVEAYRRGDTAIATPGAATIKQPLFEVIFAGSGWDRASRESLTAQLNHIGLPDGVQPASIVGSRDVAVPERINDLQIQSLIDRSMRDGSLPLRDENVVHVVFLGPNVRSTLGASRAAQDYDSYHSHFHVHDMDVRYVVVPWNDDAAVLRDAVSNSTLRAVVNPAGD